MKKHTIKIVVELFYDIEGMPDYSTSEGVAKMVEMAFDYSGTPTQLSNFNTVLGIAPADIYIEKIESA